ncbi:mechanosensitive ion channel family protein [Roseofilum casamattae]|uniref:Mechanosensitive ion channel family protein n=1 Tax=Roseofilum casamattae BLCC-M143 TaxID=3022442 RepID=A0ABT7BVB2_9CYAN|nr:mechanosensitive ion channel family protein [Roseofilum casamattae]MDJ1183132.1 mechanosensitive ion channel family protein [Roseofilum casamattae BLCC-M143]
MQNIYNLLLVVGELAVVLILFILLHSIVRFAFKKSTNISWLQDKANQVNQLKRASKKFLAFTWFLMSLAIIAVNGLLMFKGQQNLPQYTLDFIRNLPQEIWQNLLFGMLQTVAIVIVALALLRYLDPLLKVIGAKVKKFAQFAMLNSVYEQTDDFLAAIKFHVTNEMWLGVLLGAAYAFKIPDRLLSYLSTILVGYAIVALSLLLLKVASATIDSLDNLIESFFKSGTLVNRYYTNLKHLVPFGKRCLEAVLYVNMVTQVIGLIEAITGLVDVGSKLVNLIVIILLSRVFIELARLLIEEVMLTNQNLSDTDRQRRLTITPLLQSLSQYMIYFGAAIWILDIFDVDPTPILAAAGLLGLAVGLGAQNLINDMVSGFFILFENYYLVGDYIESGDASGIVEAIELRTTRIRHPNGQLYIIRNGNIEEVVNFSRDFIYAVVDIPISYKHDLQAVYNAIEQVSDDLQKNYPEVLEPVDFNGIEEFAPTFMVIRTMTKLRPNDNPRGLHDEMQGTIREMIKNMFDKQGIPPILPQQMVHLKMVEDPKINLQKS